MVDISKISDGTTTYDIKDATARSELSGKQDTLVSGTNIKTINNQSILGEGNLTIEGGNSDIEIIEIQNHSGNITLAVNTVYLGSFTANTTFVLPTPINTNIINQIKIMCSITNSPTINFGTSYFIDNKKPILENTNYNIIFEYDNFLQDWVCTITSKGIALYKFTIIPIPYDALVVLTASGYNQIGNSITVPYDAQVDYSVSKKGYISQNGTQVITNSTMRSIILSDASKVPLFIGIRHYAKNSQNAALFYGNDLINLIQNDSFPTNTGSYLNTLIYLNNTFAVSSAFNYYISDDGINWNNINFSLKIYSLYKCNTKVFLVTNTENTDTDSLYVSMDLLSWTKANGIPFDVAKRSGANKFYIGNKYYIENYYSLDGYMWNKTNLPDDGNLYYISFSHNFYFAIYKISSNTSYNLYTSNDGINWEDITSLFDKNITLILTAYKIECNNTNDHIFCYKADDNKYYASAYDGTNFYSFEYPIACIIGYIDGNPIIDTGSASDLLKYDNSINQFVNFTTRKVVTSQDETDIRFGRISLMNNCYIQDHTGSRSDGGTASKTAKYSTDLINWTLIAPNVTEIRYGEIYVY